MATRIDIDYLKLGSIVLNVILILILFKGCNCEQCPELVSQTIAVEKVYGDTSKPKVVVDVVAPEPKKVAQNAKKLAYNANKFTPNAIDSLPCDSVIELVKEYVELLPDTNYYCDSARVSNDFKIYYDAKIEGKLLEFKISHINMKPDTRTTITKTVVIKPKPQVYLGAVVGLNNTGTNFVAGPSAAVVYQSFMGNYTYDIKSGSHQLGGYWRVWGK